MSHTDEIKNVKRLINLSEDDARELEEKQTEYMGSAKRLIESYDRFEQLKVKEGKLQTLHANVTYKINFAYGDLYDTVSKISETYSRLKESGVEIGDALSGKIEQFISENRERKEHRS